MGKTSSMAMLAMKYVDDENDGKFTFLFLQIRCVLWSFEKYLDLVVILSDKPLYYF